MKVLVDENMPNLVVRNLRAFGCDVLDVRGTESEGISDDELWKLAQREKRLLITTDRAFTTRRAERHHGILIVLLRQPNRFEIAEHVDLAIRQFSDADWPGLLVVMRDFAQSTWRTHWGESR